MRRSSRRSSSAPPSLVTSFNALRVFSDAGTLAIGMLLALTPGHLRER
jgi:hypothetical protein